MTQSASSGINWRNGLFVIVYHVALIVGLPIYFYYQTPGTALIVCSIALLFLTEIGIGAAYHRFYAHRAYKMSRPAEAVLLFLATMATQGAVLRWSFDHRLHHSFSDTDKDPYSITKGFWHAHVLWLFRHRRPIDNRWVKDLLQNPLVMFQQRHILAMTFGSNILVCGIIGWLIGDFLGAFVLAWWARLALSHHLTWFVNSLCHCWGERTYSKELTAVDNYMLAIMTVGEGYHNYHHTFPSDYRNGVRWYHVDPTKWTIWLLSKLGLARDLKRVARPRIEARLLREDRRLLIKHLEKQASSMGAEVRQRVEQLAGRIQEAIGRQGALMERIRELEQSLGKSGREAVRAHLRELRRVRQELRRDWRAWNRLCCTVLA